MDKLIYGLFMSLLQTWSTIVLSAALTSLFISMLEYGKCRLPKIIYLLFPFILLSKVVASNKDVMREADANFDKLYILTKESVRESYKDALPSVEMADDDVDRIFNSIKDSDRKMFKLGYYYGSKL